MPLYLRFLPVTLVLQPTCPPLRETRLKANRKRTCPEHRSLYSSWVNPVCALAQTDKPDAERKVGGTRIRNDCLCKASCIPPPTKPMASNFDESMRWLCNICSGEHERRRERHNMLLPPRFHPSRNIVPVAPLAPACAFTPGNNASTDSLAQDRRGKTPTRRARTKTDGDLDFLSPLERPTSVSSCPVRLQHYTCCEQAGGGKTPAGRRRAAAVDARD